MAMDAVCIHALVNEISDVILDGRINKIQQTERDEIVLHIRTRERNFKLLLSASAAHPRVHLTEKSKKSPATAPMFCMLMRKQLGNGRISAVSQIGFERIIKISVESYDELGDLTIKHIIVEIMGRHSNIILVNDDMRIIDSVKHIDFTISSVRQILPGMMYQEPPKQEKTPLTDVNSDTRLDFLLPQSAQKILMTAISGISPLTAREIVYRTFLRTDITSEEMNLNKQSALKSELIKFSKEVADMKFSPCLIYSSGKLMDFSAVEIKQYGDMAEVVNVSSLSQMIDDFYSLRDMNERMRQRSADLTRFLMTGIERINKKLIILNKTIKDAENKDKYKRYGELITSSLHKIKEGDKIVSAVDYYDEAMPIIEIKLDPSISPSQNAQKYFKKYNKAKNAEIEAAKQIENGKSELDYLESTLTSVENAETDADLGAIRSELTEQGYLKKGKNPQKKNEKSKPLHFVSSDGFDIYVGKNNTQNDYLTLKFANSSDIWFHTKNIHGSHTVIKLGIDKEVPKQTMLEAAQLAAYYSKARESSQVPVDYTEIKNVRKPNGAKPGMVIYDRYNTIYVTPKIVKN